ncbi:MAG: contact-dependent growth inhibition system immunity protein [Devosia sp.]
MTAFRAFYQITSWAVYGACLLDPDGIDMDHPADLSDTELGATAREALLASRFIGPEHPDWDRVDEYSKQLDGKELENKLKARAGVKTTKALYNGAGDVSLRLKDGTISLIPMRYEGRGGFGGIKGLAPTELAENVSDEALGAAIRAAIEVSRAAARR